MKEDGPADKNASGDIHAMGFDVAVTGEGAIRAALDQIASNATGALDEPSKAFGPLYFRVNRDYLKYPGFAPFRQILRACFLADWPLGPGEVVLGGALPQRQLHSLRTAAVETGIGAKVLEPFLIEAGSLREDEHPRPDSPRLFDAQAQAGLLAEIPTLVGPIAMRNAMGATRMELEALTEAGVLKPQTRVKKV